MALLQGLDDLILDALRDIPHPKHQTVDQALALVERLAAKRAWFTHIAHDLSHVETNRRLRDAGFANVQLAYDGLQFDVSVDEGATGGESVVLIHLILQSLRNYRALSVTPGRALEPLIRHFEQTVRNFAQFMHTARVDEPETAVIASQFAEMA